MKRTYLFKAIFLVLACISLSGISNANSVSNNVTTTISGSTLSLECAFSSADVSFKSYRGYEIVKMKNCLLPEDEAGSPWLPAQYINVAIPAGFEVSDMSVSKDESLIRDDINVIPVQPPQPLSFPRAAFTQKNEEAYLSTESFPPRAAEILGNYSFGGEPYVSIRLNPLRYVAAKKSLFLASKINISLTLKPINKALSLNSNLSSTHASLFSKDSIKKIMVNPEVLDIAASQDVKATQSDGDSMQVQDESAQDAYYLIITSSSLVDSFNALANHRASFNGWTTQVVTLESIYQNSNYAGVDNQEEIRNCIIDYVNNHGTVYVVLGGDDTILPDRDCYVAVGENIGDDIPTDFYYAGLDGNWDEDGDGVYGESGTAVGDEGDLDADVIVGRIPVRTQAQASAYINKLIDFENNPPSDEFKKKVFISANYLWDIYAGDDRPSDTLYDGLLGFREHDYVSDGEMWTRRLYRDAIQPFMSSPVVKGFFDYVSSWDSSTPGDYTLNASNLLAKLNEGCYFLFKEGHGYDDSWALKSGSFVSANAEALTADTTFVYTTSCLTAHFDGDTDPCLSEAFLRNAQGGALAYFGSSRYGWGAPEFETASDTSTGGESFQYAYKFYNELFNSGEVILGKIFYLHKADLVGRSSAGTYRWLQFSLNYQGDPAISMSILDNNPPKANDDHSDVTKDTPVIIDVLANDFDPDGDSVSVVSVGAAANGSVSFTSTNVTYTPNPDWVGTDNFSYTISDGNGNTSTANVSVIVTATTFLAHLNDSANWDINPANGDYSLGAPNATIYGDISSTNGLFASSTPANKAASFNDSSAIIIFPDGSGNIDYASGTSGGITVGCWLKIQGTGAVTATVFQVGTGLDGITLKYGANEDGKATLEFGDGFEFYTAQDSATNTRAYISNWVYFAVTVDLTNSCCILRQYDESGNLIATDTVNITVTDWNAKDDGEYGSSKIKLGGWLAGNTEKYFIEEFSLDNYVLTADQIQTRVDTMVAGIELKANALRTATNPSPANGDNGVAVNAELTWTNGWLAASHDIYVGTDAAAVAVADRSSELYKANIPANSPSTFDPELGYGATYYWRVDAVNSLGTVDTLGNVWQFTTDKTAFTVTGDLNGDSIVDIADLNIFASQWLNPPGCPTPTCADFDGVNGVDIEDLAELIANW